MTLNDNIHCIRARIGLRLKRVKGMLCALNHQVLDKPVRCLMSLKSDMYVFHHNDLGKLQTVTVDNKRIHLVDIVSIGI